VGETMARATPAVDAVFDVVVRPRAALVRSTLLSIVFSAVPLAVALVWVSFPVRLWAVLATIVVLLAAFVGVVFVRLRTAFVGVDQRGIELRGVLSPTRRIARDTVDRLVLATTFGASPDRTSRDLVALDVSGVPLFRMRSVVWDEHGIEAVVDALGVQVSEADRPMSVREFMREYPASRAWYERPRGYLLVSGVTAALVVGVLAVETLGLLHP
jgi:hypothetical protein